MTEFQWNEKEKIILDELWIVLEEKLELRKQLLQARQAVSDKLSHIDEFERQQGMIYTFLYFIELIMFDSRG